ncbi:MAG TPA: T9SS type A sorting domain-containing protein [Candidatus Kapabacteria bacterium]
MSRAYCKQGFLPTSFKMNRFHIFILVLFISFLSFGTALAQETNPLIPKKWGLEQRLLERQKYEDSWRYSGPDSNIDEARKRGLQQFLSIKRKNTSQQIQNTSAWEQVAGSQEGSVSGRPSGIAFDPRSNNTIYLATSGGGLWKTTDAGESWFSLSDTWSSYAMGDVEVDPKNPDIVYAGTGDLHDQPGDGMYKSTDAGLNWTHITNSLVVGRTSQIIIDPVNTNIVYCVTSQRVVKSTNGGDSWVSKLTIGNSPHMVIDPTNPNTLVVAGDGSIVRSTDGGETWTDDLASNIGSKGRITMALSKKDPSKLYASVGGTNGASRGLARSIDSGKTWTLSAPNTEYMGQQAWYDNACAASPASAKIAVVGGLDVWNTNDSGKTLVKKSEWTRPNSAGDFCHADIHVLEYSPSGDLFALTDGGIFMSKYNGASWTQKYNAKLSTLLFVGADAAADFSYVIGGCQDNGVNKADITDPYFKQVRGGDGGRTFVAQTGGSDIAYSTYIGATLFVSLTRGTTWQGGAGGTSDGNMIPLNSSLRTEGAPFYMFYDVCESEGSAIALCGNSRLYYSLDGCSTLDPISKSGTFNGGLRTVHIAKGDLSVVYAGTGGGYTYTTKDIGETWTRSTNKIGTAAGFTTDFNDACKVYAVTSGFGGKHFFRSADCGTTWESPDVNLPDLDTRTIARAPNGDLFIGHTYGVMRSIDNGVTWESLRDGLPLCDVRKLQVRGTSGEYLMAATYGRGIFRINIAELPRTIVNSVDASAPKNNKLKVTSLSPNPVTATGTLTLNYEVKDDGELRAEIYDEAGKQVRTFGVTYAISGIGKLEGAVSGLTSGAYFMVITANGEAAVQKFIIG